MKVKRTKSHKRLTKKEYEALFSLRYTLRQFLKFSEEAAGAVGLTPNQHQALLAIKGYPGREHLTNGELAARLHIKPHSAVGLVNRLEAQGLVVRHQGEHDRRYFYVSLTKRGGELLERLAAIHKEELKHIAPRLSTLLESIEGAS